MPLDQSVRPTPGGYEIHCGPTMRAGTLGATILWSPHGKDRQRIGISNAHVLPVKGAPVFQPNQVGYADARQIGVVAGVCAAVLYETTDAYFLDMENRSDARFDFAYFQALPAETSTRITGGLYTGPMGRLHEWLGIDPAPLEVRAPRRGEQVRWIGKSTAAVRSGRIVDLDYWGLMRRSRDPDRWVGLAGLVKMELLSGPTLAGDSGAALVATTDQRIVGLFCGSTQDEKFGLGSKIPEDDIELGETLPVSDALAMARLTQYEKKPGEVVVVQ
ncbi:hypothetical protein ACGFX2_34805 [Streptomyces goshikiensis]|uniref:hypothetical protein n=1 Tax=Streptomyces goshikiensis TaxID=1942 RepID=UPI003723F203